MAGCDSASAIGLDLPLRYHTCDIIAVGITENVLSLAKSIPWRVVDAPWEVLSTIPDTEDFSIPLSAYFIYYFKVCKSFSAYWTKAGRP